MFFKEMYHTVCFSTACSSSLCMCAIVCVFSSTVSWYLAKKCVILYELPCIWQGSQTDRLGCMSAISSAWLPERFSLVPPSSFLPHLPITLLHWWPAGQGIFFLHLTYLPSCRSPWIKSTHCSITVATVTDGSAVCLPALEPGRELVTGWG